MRKTRPKIETPFKCYVYMTSKGNRPIKEIETPNGSAYVEVDYKMAGKVIGSFVCDEIYARPANVIYYGKGQEDYIDNIKNSCYTENERTGSVSKGEKGRTLPEETNLKKPRRYVQCSGDFRINL